MPKVILSFLTHWLSYAPINRHLIVGSIGVIVATGSSIARLTRHIPEKGFRMVRYYGMLANRLRGKLLLIAYQLLDQVAGVTYPLRFSYLSMKTFKFDPLACLICQQKMTLRSRQVGYNFQQLKARHEKLAHMSPI